VSLTVISAPGRPVYTTAPPASRASWTGQLRVAHLTIPVKAYAAVVTTDSPLKQLHAGCGERIEYRKWCPKHGIVPNDAIIKGYPYGTDSYVQLAEEELAALQPAEDKTLVLEQFLDRDQLDLILLSGRSLYLAPSLPAARQPFALLLAALRSTEKWAVGRVILSNNRQVVMVRPDEQTLVVHVLYFPAQQRAAVGIEPGGVELGRKDIAAMERIIHAADGPVPWDDYKDDSESRLSQLVQAKVAAASNGHSRRRNGNAKPQSLPKAA
jgi:DNA end-binding protein Ku